MEWHVRNTSQPTTSNKGNKGRIEEERDHAQARRSPGRKRNAKNEDPDSPMPQRLKHRVVVVVGQPANTGMVGHGPEVREGMVWW